MYLSDLGRSAKMKSLRVYLPGNRTPTFAGWFVILIGILWMFLGFFKIWNHEGIIRTEELLRIKLYMVFGSFMIISVGFIILRILRIPFAKDAADGK